MPSDLGGTRYSGSPPVARPSWPLLELLQLLELLFPLAAVLCPAGHRGSLDRTLVAPA